MSSKATQIIAPDANNPQFDAEVYVDGTTNALLVKVVNPGGGGGGPTADVNLASYGGVAVGAANAVHVQPGTGAVWAAIQSGSWIVAVSNFPSVYPVNDNGGSLTVDGTVAATQSGTWSVTATQATHANLNAQVRLQDRDSASMLSVLVADVAAVFPMTETGTLPLFLVTDSPAPGSAGIFTYPRMSEAGGLYVTVLNTSTLLESTTHVSGDVGTQTLAVRRDAGTPLALDGQYHPLMLNSTGRLYVDVGTPAVSVSAVVPGTGATNLGKAEDAVHASGDVGVMPLGVLQAVDAALAADGDYVPFTMNGLGRLKANVHLEGGGSALTLDVYQADTTADRTAVGVVALCQVTAGAPTVAGDGRWQFPFLNTSGHLLVSAATVGTITPGTAATNLGKAEDAAHTTGDVGVMMLAVRNDTASALAGTNGDYIPITTDNAGRVHVLIGNTSLATTVSAITPGTGATNLGKGEDNPHASGDVGVQVLAVRRDTLATSTSLDGDYATFSVDRLGALWVRSSDVQTLALSASTRGRPIQVTGTSSGTANTLHTATTTSGQVDRLFLYLTNTSTAAVLVTIEFGTTGTANELKVLVPANATIEAIAGAVIGGGSTDTVRAYAATGSVINAIGRIERLTA